MEGINRQFILKEEHFLEFKNALPTKKGSRFIVLLCQVLALLITLGVLIYTILYFLLKRLLPSKFFNKFIRISSTNSNDSVEKKKINFRECEINYVFEESACMYGVHEFKYENIEKALETNSAFIFFMKRKRFKRKKLAFIFPKDSINLIDFLFFLNKIQRKYSFVIEKNIETESV